MIEIIPATADHIRAIYGASLPMSFRAFAAVEENRVLGVGGIYLHDGCEVVFVRMTDELRAHKKTILRGAIKVMSLFGSRVVAICDPSIPKAREFLEHFGFRRISGEVYVWTR